MLESLHASSVARRFSAAELKRYTITAMNALISTRRAKTVKRRALLLLCLLACHPAVLAAPALRVAVGVPVLQTFVQRIGGERVETLILQGNGDPHAFEPSGRQIAALADARLYILAGLPFESAWLPRLQAIHPGLMVMDLRRTVPTRPLDDPGSTRGDAGQPADPHVWTDPAGALQLVDAIRDQLTALDPAGQPAYETASRQLRRDLEALEAEITPLLAPQRGRALLVFHPGWGYLADHHGLVQVPLEVGGREPGALQLERIMALARRERAGALFLQPGHGDRLARQVAGELGIPVVVADPLAADYFGNVRILARALATASVAP